MQKQTREYLEKFIDDMYTKIDELHESDEFLNTVSKWIVGNFTKDGKFIPELLCIHDEFYEYFCQLVTMDEEDILNMPVLLASTPICLTKPETWFLDDARKEKWETVVNKYETLQEKEERERLQKRIEEHRKKVEEYVKKLKQHNEVVDVEVDDEVVRVINKTKPGDVLEVELGNNYETCFETEKKLEDTVKSVEWYEWAKTKHEGFVEWVHKIKNGTIPIIQILEDKKPIFELFYGERIKKVPRNLLGHVIGRNGSNVKTIRNIFKYNVKLEEVEPIPCNSKKLFVNKPSYSDVVPKPELVINPEKIEKENKENGITL